MACRLTPMPKSRFACNPLDTELRIMQENCFYSSVIVLLFGRYYDFKRSAEKKEQKTIEAADKVRKLFSFDTFGLRHEKM